MQDRENLTRLFQSHYGLVVGAASRYAPSPDCIDDVVQQVYVEFVSKSLEGKLEVKKDAGALLYQIAKHEAFDLWAERRKQETTPIDLVVERLAGKDEKQSDDDWRQTESMLRGLKHCMEKLSVKHRSLIEQHYFEGVPMNEIARQHGQNENNVYRFFYRVRIQLRKCIEKLVTEQEKTDP